MFGLTADKIIIIAVIAVFLLGPERVPMYAAKLAQLVKNVRNMAKDAKSRMRDEMGEDFDDVDWQKLDPRQYDPRRIIREALLDDEEPQKSVIAPAAKEPKPESRQQQLESGREVMAPPFDAEAT
ncbi:Sec-independent protein translocase TatB [Paramicrobacterium chengjingii]|uniref:Sec-independent protein translocase TatB n=1 Tax=Paramicrobacterium chengjingii TaxID=2769067 RepID=A0ABX6YLG7_9MICO|nr:Sec-independent protein translocase TatB [Microbacterium chengjingii]QPZ39644.1 Sec-independent protein translocase TatB [Microbacterium chengjingii]